MAENFADAIIEYASVWAEASRTNRINFTYGVLYGTLRQSNKKDWHILRNLREKAEEGGHPVSVHPDGRWTCSLTIRDIDITATIRVGMDWWEYLGGQTCAVEVWTALIRACVDPRGSTDPTSDFEISDMSEIISMAGVPASYNPSLLQRSQIPWLFLVARHFCDELT